MADCPGKSAVAVGRCRRALPWKRRIGGLVRFDWTADRFGQQTRLPSFYVMEADVWARLGRRLRAAVRVDNLTNNAYLMLPGLRALPTTVTATVEGTWQ